MAMKEKSLPKDWHMKRHNTVEPVGVPETGVVGGSGKQGKREPILTTKSTTKKKVSTSGGADEPSKEVT